MILWVLIIHARLVRYTSYATLAAKWVIRESWKKAWRADNILNRGTARPRWSPYILGALFQDQTSIGNTVTQFLFVGWWHTFEQSV